MKTNAAPAKKMPVRMCVGCREHKPKKELIRVVRSPEGEISLPFPRNRRSSWITRLCWNSTARPATRN